VVFVRPKNNGPLENEAVMDAGGDSHTRPNECVLRGHEQKTHMNPARDFTLLRCFWVVCLTPPLESPGEKALCASSRSTRKHKCARRKSSLPPGAGAGESLARALNNVGNHYVVCGEGKRLKPILKRLFRSNPKHVTAISNWLALRPAERGSARSELPVARSTIRSRKSNAGREAWHGSGKQAGGVAAIESLRDETRGDFTPGLPAWMN